MPRISWRAVSAPGTLAVASATAILLTFAPTAAAAGHQVQISDSAFGTQVLTVQVGDTVTWNNVDDRPHTVTSAGAFDSGNLDEGASFSFTFTEPGTYDYICEYHPDMRATVVVQAAATPATPAPATPAPASAATAAPAADESTTEADPGHGTAHGDQPDTAMALERSLPPASMLLWGLALGCLAIAVLPSRRRSSAMSLRPPGGWRR